MSRRLERFGLWLGTSVGGAGLIYAALVASPDTAPALLGVLWVLGSALLAVGILGFASETVALIGRLLPDESVAPKHHGDRYRRAVHTAITWLYRRDKGVAMTYRGEMREQIPWQDYARHRYAALGLDDEQIEPWEMGAPPEPPVSPTAPQSPESSKHD